MRLHSRAAVVLAALLTLAASAPIPSQYASDLLDPSSPEFDAVVFKRYFKLRLSPEPNTLQPHHDKCKKKWEAKGAAPDPAREKARAKARAKADTGAAAAKISPNSQLFEVEGKETAGERDLDLPDTDKPRFAAVLTPIVKIAAVVGAVVVVFVALGLFDNTKDSVPGPRDWSSVAAVKGGNGWNC